MYNFNMITNRLRNKYYKYLKLPMQQSLIFVDSFFSLKDNGEIYLFIKQIIEHYPDHQIILSIKNKEYIQDNSLDNSLLNKSIKKIVIKESKEYYKYLAISKFIVSDMTLPFDFIKRDDQIYFNIWHGTPWKRLNLISHVNESYISISDTQKNFYLADRVIVNNNFSSLILPNDYSFRLLKNNRILKTSNFNMRKHVNSFFKTNEIMILYIWSDKYLNNTDLFQKTLLTIDDTIKNYPEYNFKITLHFALNTYNNRKWINKNLEKLEIIDNNDINYEIVSSDNTFTNNLSNLFNSDLFNIVLLRKNILLDTTDIPRHHKDYGLYDSNNFISLKSFTNMAKSLDKAIRLSTEKHNIDNLSSYNKNFNNRDFDNTVNWADEMIKLNYDSKKWDSTILIYPGTLKTNGITTSFIETVKILLNQNKQIVIFLTKLYNKKDDVILLRKLFKNKIDIIFSDYRTQQSLLEKASIYFYIRFNTKFITYFKNKTNFFFEMEKRRIFGDIEFEKVVNFSGYEWYITGLFGRFSNSEKNIYVHNDMILEHKTRKNFSKSIIFDNYYVFDKIIFPSSSLSKDLILKSKTFQNNFDKFIIIPNPIRSTIENKDVKQIKFKKNEIILKKLLRENNNKYWDSQSLYSILYSSDIKKIIYVGRMSFEKNIPLTIKSFLKFRKNYDKNSFLFIFTTKLNKRLKSNFFYNLQMKWYTGFSKNRKNLIFLQGFKGEMIDHVLPLFNLMLFLSRYEGQGLSAIEAATKGVPVIASNIGTSIELERNWKIINTIDPNKDNIADEMLITLKKESIADINDEIEYIKSARNKIIKHYVN